MINMFHIREALMRRIRNKGLRALYNKDTDFLIVQDWLWQILAMPMLRSEFEYVVFVQKLRFYTEYAVWLLEFCVLD